MPTMGPRLAADKVRLASRHENKASPSRLSRPFFLNLGEPEVARQPCLSLQDRNDRTELTSRFAEAKEQLTNNQT